MDSISKKQLKEKIAVAKQYFRAGDFDRSEFEFKRSLEFSEEAESYFYLGLLANQKKFLDKALSYYYKAFEINPDYGNPCNEIGVILLRLGRDRDAVYWLKKSIKCRENEALHIPLYNLATLYKIWNRPERSLQYLHKAINLNPEFSEAIKLRDEILLLD